MLADRKLTDHIQNIIIGRNTKSNIQVEVKMSRLSVGEKMPNFTFNTAYEQGKTVGDMVSQRKTVFWVLRYIGCTSCRYDVHDISQRYSEFLQKGVQVAVVMQSEPAVARESIGEARLPFDIICDTDMEIYKALEILPASSMEELLGNDPAFIAKFEEKRKKIKESGFTHGKYEGDEQQLPALFIVNTDRRIEYAHYAKSIADMPTVDELLAIL